MKKILTGFVERFQPFRKIEGVVVEHYSPLLAKMILEEAEEQVDYTLLETASGHSSYFVYDRLKPWVYDLELRKVFLKSVEVAGWKPCIYSPKDFEDAYDFIRKSVEQGKPVFAEYYEPIVFYGIDKTADEPKIHWFCAPFAPEDAMWTKKELRERWWAWLPHKGANELIILDKPLDQRPDPRDIAITTMKFMVNRAKTKEYMGSPSGFNAYSSYVKDLRDDTIDWINEATHLRNEKSIVWGCWAIYHQWTLRIFSAQYLESVATMFTGETQEHIKKAAGYYRRCVEAWLSWERLLGRDWELIEDKSLDEETKQKKNKEGIEERWGDIENRRKAADFVEEAGRWEREAVDELEKALKIITA